ncbi:MAG TPA: hypothetical protein PKC91_10775 [Ignavibacteria bacterium]|nr:hypothetical protein [Ignavibacteria bacterium]
MRYNIAKKTAEYLYDILGNEIKTLVNEIKLPGTFEVDFDGSNLTSGVYICRIEPGEFRDIRRTVLIK